MLNRRNLLIKSSSLLLASSVFINPKPTLSQESSDHITILTDGYLGEQGYFFLRNLSSTFISFRANFGGPFGYESRPFWTTGAYTAWSSAFEPYVGRDGRVLLAPDPGAFTENIASDRNDFVNSEFGQSLASKLIENFDEQREVFTAWCEDVGISPESRLFNGIISAQALFAVQFGTYNEAKMLNEEGENFFEKFTWVWPFCGSPL